jgi:putative transposase
MTADIVMDALTMAWFRRKQAPGLVHHSDRGRQYASHAFQARLKAFGMVCSMSRKGNYRHNAPTERFFNSLKNERVHGTRYGARAEAEADLFGYIVPFYNRKRRHSTLGYAPALTCLANRISAQYEKTDGIMPRDWKTKNRGKLKAYIERLQIMVPNFTNLEIEAK